MINLVLLFCLQKAKLENTIQDVKDKVQEERRQVGTENSEI